MRSESVLLSRLASPPYMLTHLGRDFGSRKIVSIFAMETLATVSPRNAKILLPDTLLRLVVKPSSVERVSHFPASVAGFAFVVLDLATLELEPSSAAKPEVEKSAIHKLSTSDGNDLFMGDYLNRKLG